MSSPDVSRTPDNPERTWEMYGHGEQVKPFRARPRADFLTPDDVTAGLRWATVERSRGDSAAANRILRELHRSAIRTWGVGHRQLAPIEAAAHRWNVRLAEVARERTTVHAEPIVTDDMVERAAKELHSDYDSEFDAAHLSWQDFTGAARKVLSAALAGCTVTPTPEPHQVREDATIWVAEARRIAASVDGTGHPFVLLDSQLWLVTEAEAVGAALVAAARDAQRRAAERARGSQVGDQLDVLPRPETQDSISRPPVRQRRP